MDAARPHLVWDWNGTLLNDLDLVVASTNAAFASVGGPAVTADEHRVRFRRPVADYYAEVLGKAVDDEAYGRLDEIFHDAYRSGLTTCRLAHDAQVAMASWPGSQSLDDADAAREVGGRAVLYTGGITDPARLRVCGHPVADTLTDAVRVAAALTDGGDQLRR